jgi:hypothetical protein
MNDPIKKQDKDIRVLWISTYKISCGIATYSENLIEQLERLGVSVEIFSNPTDYNALSRLAKESVADIVHIQHEFGISMTPEPLMSIIGKFRMCGKPVVLTMHTESKPINILLDGVADAIILHNDIYDMQNKKTFTKFYKVPHGIPEISFKEAKQFYKKKYGIPEDAFVIGTCGFVSKERAKNIEEFVLNMATAMKQDTRLFIHLPVSSHRTDEGGQFANLIKNSVASIAKKFNFEDRLLMTAEFMNREEFRERLFTFDLGFAYGAERSTSNSGAVADIISCGVPVVVNNADHFNHIKPYCRVVDGSMADLVREIIKVSESKEEQEELIKKASQAVADIGYSIIAKKHIEVYKHCLNEAAVPKKVTDPEVLTTEQRATAFTKLSRTMPITLNLPNSMWQVLLLWRKIQVLINNDFPIRLVIQNDKLMDIHTLKFVLKGICDIAFCDIGLQQDDRLVRLHSRSMSQNLTTDVESWLREGHSFSSLFNFLDNGIGLDYECKLGEYAEKAAKKLIGDKTLVVIADKDNLPEIDTVLEYSKGGFTICVAGTPLMEEDVKQTYDFLETYVNKKQLKTVIEDFRTIMACCKEATRTYSSWNTFGAFCLTQRLPVFLWFGEEWQKKLYNEFLQSSATAKKPTEENYE